MKKLTFQHHNTNIEFGVDSFKFLVGPNQILKSKITNLLTMFKNKLPDSDYLQEHELTNFIKLDGAIITQRNTDVFIVHPYVDFKNELKLRRDAILKSYLESKLSNLELDEEYTTLSILFKDFSEVLNAYVNNDEDIMLDIQLPDLTIDQIVKLVQPTIQKEHLSIHFDELSHDEQIYLWITMLESIAKEKMNKMHICYLKAITLSNDNLKRLEKLELDNLILLVDTELPLNTNLDNIAYFTDITLDLFNENEIYENITLNSPKLKTLKETKTVLQALINKSETADLKAIL